MIGILARIAVAVAIIVVGGVAIDSVATNDRMQTYVNESAEWCEAHNGTLENSRVGGEHGGLHCELPNGTTVHMDEVVTVEGQG